MRTELLAILPGPAPAVLPELCRAVAAAGLTAVLLPAAPLSFQPLAGRKALLQRALLRQQRLEALMPQGPVLPALSGQSLTAAEAGPMLAANAPLFAALARRLEGRVQYQLQIGWDAAALPARFPAEPPEAVRARFVAAIEASLSGLAEELIPLPLADPLIANLALLLPAARQPALDQTLQRIDALWTEGLSIRQIGPSPAVSFASIGLRPLSAARLRAARRRLALAGPLEAESLRAARRRCLKTAPEAGRPAILQAAEDLAALLACPGLEAGGLCAFLWSEAGAGPAESRAA